MLGIGILMGFATMAFRSGAFSWSEQPPAPRSRAEQMSILAAANFITPSRGNLLGRVTRRDATAEVLQFFEENMLFCIKAQKRAIDNKKRSMKAVPSSILAE